ncbi:MAG TPA: STAS domain-containing protein [Nevskiaceae bacterium]|nr:STAS domain-containing protein [Nevskiaceae bacterium]
MAGLPSHLLFGDVEPLLAHSGALVEHGELDLSGVERIDSAGIALLLELTRRARAAGKPLHLCGLAERPRALIDFMGVGELLDLDPPGEVSDAL